MKVGTNSQNKYGIYVRTDAVNKLNLKSGKWEAFLGLKSRRCAHQSTIVGDKMYLVGGYNGTHLADTEIIPISKNDKTVIPTIPPMHIERCVFGMCSFGGCIFVAGGMYNRNETLDKCEVYSTESCKWIEASSMNTKRSSFPLIYFQDIIWAIGGRSHKAILDTIETYNLAANKWTTVDTKLLTKRFGHSAVVHKQKFFIIGGSYRNKALSSVEVYSIETNQFSFVPPMSQARWFFGCSVFNNNLIVYGGHLSKTENTDSIEVYDIEKQAWSKGTHLPLPLAKFGYACTN